MKKVRRLRQTKVKLQNDKVMVTMNLKKTRENANSEDQNEGENVLNEISAGSPKAKKYK